MVVEELLELLVGEVDAELLIRVHHKDLETSNVKHTNEEVLSSLQCGGIIIVNGYFYQFLLLLLATFTNFYNFY